MKVWMTHMYERSWTATVPQQRTVTVQTVLIKWLLELAQVALLRSVVA